MKLYERFSDAGFHTCITTTFGVDFDAYENIVLPRLRGSSCSNNILLLDGRMLTFALDGLSLLPEHAGRHYTVLGIETKGVFHPKITLQLGRRTGRVIISSANITASGLAGNLELAGSLFCTEEPSGEARLVAAAWDYIERLLRVDSEAITHQRVWLGPRTPWLFDTEPATDVVGLTDGSAAALLTTNGNGNAGIGTRFATLIDGERVDRLIVLSPYWDNDLAALATIVANLTPERVAILIDRETQLFPAHAVSAIERAEIFDLNAFGKSRFIHAKAIIAETEYADHVLYGSANCTAAALGTGNYSGANYEACLYRRLPPGSILAALGLARVVDEGLAIQVEELPPYRQSEELPLAEMSQRSPGQFEYAFDKLFWRPPKSLNSESAIELLDAAGKQLSTQLIPLASASDARRVLQVGGSRARPAFARLRFSNGQTSALAIVTIVDALRETVREARSKRAEAAALQLSDETEEGLWLWEVLNELESAELEQQSQKPGVKRSKDSATDEGAEEPHRTLEYEQFIAGRRLRSEDEGAVRNSLAGTELSLIRSFLNRLLRIGDDTETATTPDKEAMVRGLDLQDEISDAVAALERGEQSTVAPEAPDDPTLPKEEERRKAARVRASREQIVHAVATFRSRLQEKVHSGKLGSFDVLRLRAILMIIAAAGQPPNGTGHLTELQVLPLSNDSDGWPKLMGQLLFAFFGGNCPAIRHLEIEASHDQLPKDILEGWATALWAIQACVCAAHTHKSIQPHTLKPLTHLADQIYARTGLRPQELRGESISTTLNKLNDRFCGRLGLSFREIEHQHAQKISALGINR